MLTDSIANRGAIVQPAASAKTDEVVIGRF
eukprot:SAG31_NODE_265_length_18823_cov_5.968863_9_plen_30_part_00